MPKFSELKISAKAQHSRGKSITEISVSEDVSPSLVEVTLLDGDDQTRMAQLKVGVQPYDVWNFSGCDPRFGADYPGRQLEFQGGGGAARRLAPSMEDGCVP